MKNLTNLGKTLNKNEQKEINGGRRKPTMCGPYVFGAPVVACYFPAICMVSPQGTPYCG